MNKHCIAVFLGVVLIAKAWAIHPDITTVSTSEVDIPMVALTFDDGPHKVYTPKLLDGLKKRNVRATFFVLGESVEQNPDLIKRMSKEGHLIGSHTYSHVQLTKLSIEEAEEEIHRANQSIYEACSQYPKFVRPPYGSWNKTLEEKTDMNAILWSVDPYDWKIQDKDRIVKEVLENVEDGSIILLHDIYETSVDAALEIVDELKKQGYLFATIEELQID